MSTPWIVAVLALWAFLLVVTVILIGVVRRVLPLLTALEVRLEDPAVLEVLQGLGPGTSLPGIEARDSAGNSVSFADLIGRPSVFLLLDPGCQPCEELAAEIAASDEGIGGIPLYAVAEDHEQGRRWALGAQAVVLYVKGADISRSFRSSVRPLAFGVDGRGIVVGRMIPRTLADLTQLGRDAVEGGGQLGTTEAVSRAS